jgi:hypothetical protein
MKTPLPTLTSRVTFRFGAYVSGSQTTAFDAVAHAISNARCALSSVDVLFVEIIENPEDDFLSFPALRERTKEETLRRYGRA